ncbi:C40 family peptidase [Streptomyces sp. NPDC088752]|uniref:C40 family peptidase n=1 Tax=Streptomyces sp. NPDC088752 TaxID=3154963 RepID=UPI003422D5BD
MTSVSSSRVALAVALGTATLSLSLGTASPAEAATLKQAALNVAAAQKGDPYRWGATGPNAFDCSGLVKYSYGKAGKSLARTAQAQYNNSRHIAWTSRQRGDLVAIGTSSGNIVHIGLYAGVWSNKSWYWHAPKPGQTVRLSPIKDSLWRGARAYYGQVK